MPLTDGKKSLLPLDRQQRPSAENALAWGRDAMRERKWREAAERWAILRKVYPDHAPVWIQASIAHRQLFEYLEAEALLEEASKLFADNPNVLVQWVELNIARKDWVAALDHLQALRERFPNEIAGWVRVADVHAEQANYEQAVNANAEARKKFPDFPWPWVQYAELAMRQQDWSLALERWAEVRKHFPKHDAGYSRAAEAAYQSGDERLARQLKAARVYGNEWLSNFSDDNDEAEVRPPRRRSIFAFLDLVWSKARLNLKSEANQNYLRYFWWLLDPLLYMSVFYIVFGIIFSRGGEGFVAYLLTGLVPFQWFAKTVQQSSNSLIAGKGLMHQIRISPLFFPLVGIVQNGGKQMLVFLMLAVFLIFYGLPPTLHWLALIPIILTQLLLMVVVSCLVAVIVPFVRDVSNLVPTGIQFLMFASGIFFTVDHLSETAQQLFYLNPIANILLQYRTVLLDQQWPDWSMLGGLLVAVAASLLFVIWLYHKLEKLLPRVVIE